MVKIYEPLSGITFECDMEKIYEVIERVNRTAFSRVAERGFREPYKISLEEVFKRLIGEDFTNGDLQDVEFVYYDMFSHYDVQFFPTIHENEPAMEIIFDPEPTFRGAE